MENKNIYTVYVHTDPDNKKYVGITKRDPEDRWKNGYGYATNSNSKFYDAIRDIGWENFTHEIIATNLLKEDAEQLERELISQYDSTNEMCGYNFLDGVPRNDKNKKQYTNTLRMTPEMGHKLQLIADKELRTVNNLITYVLTKYIEQYNLDKC